MSVFHGPVQFCLKLNKEVRMKVTREEILEIIDGAGVSVNVADIKCDLSFKKVGIDSLEMMNVFLAIEQKFDIKIDDDDVNALDSVDSIISYLESV